MALLKPGGTELSEPFTWRLLGRLVSCPVVPVPGLEKKMPVK